MGEGAPIVGVEMGRGMREVGEYKHIKSQKKNNAKLFKTPICTKDLQALFCQDESSALSRLDVWGCDTLCFLVNWSLHFSVGCPLVRLTMFICHLDN